MLKVILAAAALAAGLSAAGCAPKPEYETPDVPVMRWDHRPEARQWTLATMNALATHGAILAQSTPSDVDAWCPAYRTAPIEQRRAFWAGLFSALGKHESTWRPEAVGGGGKWFGLVQISPRTAKGHGCRVSSGNALKDGAANLSCAVRIAANQVPKRNSVAQGMRDWGPFHSASKRADMQAWTRSQDYCQITG